MTIYVLALAVMLNGDYQVMFVADKSGQPKLYKNLEACENDRKAKQEEIAEEIREAGASFMLKCITAAQAAKITKNPGV